MQVNASIWWYLLEWFVWCHRVKVDNSYHLRVCNSLSGCWADLRSGSVSHRLIYQKMALILIFANTYYLLQLII